MLKCDLLLCVILEKFLCRSGNTRCHIALISYLVLAIL